MIQQPTENTHKSIESFDPICVDQSFGETSYLTSVILWPNAWCCTKSSWNHDEHSCRALLHKMFGLCLNDMCWSYRSQKHPKTLLFNRCLSDCNAILGPQITLDFNQHGESFLVAKPHTPRSPPSLICLAKRAFHWAQHGCRAGRGASGWEISKLRCHNSRSSCWGGRLCSNGIHWWVDSLMVSN